VATLEDLADFEVAIVVLETAELVDFRVDLSRPNTLFCIVTTLEELMNFDKVSLEVLTVELADVVLDLSKEARRVLWDTVLLEVLVELYIEFREDWLRSSNGQRLVELCIDTCRVLCGKDLVEASDISEFWILLMDISVSPSASLPVSVSVSVSVSSSQGLSLSQELSLSPELSIWRASSATLARCPFD